MMERAVRRCFKWYLQSRHVPAIVFGSSYNALSYARSLGRRGVPVLCADTQPGIASKSRFSAFTLLDTEPNESVPGEKAADCLLAKVKARGVMPIVFGAADQWQIFVASRASLEQSGFRTIVPSESTMARIVDKQDQYEFASQLGIIVPPFANARDVMEGRALWKPYPAIVKPRWAHTGRAALGAKAVRVNNESELRSTLAQLDTTIEVNSYLVQAVVGGGDDSLYAYLACYDGEGREISSLVKRKLRQYPPSFGDGAYDTICIDNEVTAAGRTLAAALEYRGLVGIEFKREAVTGALSMIEINPRTVSNNQLAITAGVDFPWQAYRLSLGEDLSEAGEQATTATPEYRIGICHVHEERDFRLFLQRWRNGEARLIEWLRCVLTAESYAIWDRGDPMPLVWTAWDGIIRSLKRTVRPSQNKTTALRRRDTVSQATSELSPETQQRSPMKQASLQQDPA